MSILASPFGSRRRKHDLVPMTEEPTDDSRRDVFDLIPPRAEDLDRLSAPARFESARMDELTAALAPLETVPAASAPPPAPVPTPPVLAPAPLVVSPVAEVSAVAPAPKPKGRNRKPVDMTDLSRLSIDGDGRLYWDGKPVEVRRQISMSRGQIAGASLFGAFIVLGGIAAAFQGSVAAYDWGCRLGWVSNYCPAAPAQGAPAPHPNIPA